MTLEKLPRVLILHLKRFIYSKTGSQKLQKPIDYPLELNISKGMFQGQIREGVQKSAVTPMFVIWALSLKISILSVCLSVCVMDDEKE